MKTDMESAKKDEAPDQKPRRGGSLLRSGAAAASATMLSRILGMVRDIVIANVLGAGLAADVFFFANRIPNFFRRLFAEGAFAQAFVPVLTKTRKDQGETEMRDLTSCCAGTLGAVVLGVTLLGMLLSPVLTALFGFGWFKAWLYDEPDGTKFTEAATLLRLTFPYLFFITLTALTSSVLNVFGKFGIPAITPCILNLTLIALVLCCGHLTDNPNRLLAWGMVAGGVLQLFFQLPFMLKTGMLARPRWGWHHPGVRRIRELMLPAIIGVSASQLNLFVNTVLASFLATGAISYLYYSDRLLELPIGIFAVAVSTVILPALSRVSLSQDGATYRRTLEWGVRLVLFLGIPSMCGIIALREPILRVLFMRGAFTPESVHCAAASLLASVSGLCAIMLVRVLVQGFAAIQDTRTPVRCSLTSIAANIVFNLILIVPLGYVGLALSTALAAFVNCGMLLYLLHRRGIYTPSRACLSFTMRAALAGAIMATGIILLSPEFELWAALDTLRATELLFACIAGGGSAYLILCLLLGLRPQMLRS